ncbi:hypothetical protein Bca52824_023362 [Brassica carinata]|uniref:Uncharacterized protein n=1 Tax=Brassica carinata TaxID=52824 RepID=A0A8X7VIW0_BRACI|nr:hypothetical protein Bca52824_023362 [Brassica carinata]
MGGRNRKSLRSFVSSSSRAVQERERSEFRVLQAQVGLVPDKEIGVSYDSGLAVGKGVRVVQVCRFRKKSEGTSVVFFLMITIGSKANASSHQMVSSLALLKLKTSLKSLFPLLHLVRGLSRTSTSRLLNGLGWYNMLKYPSAITSFGHIAAQAKDKKIAVFLDYDGTLVDV